MSTRLNPYLSFRDNAREAMEFYRSVFGGELSVNTFDEVGMSEDPAEAKKIGHSQLTTDSDFTLMGADTPSSMEHTPGNTMSISLSGGSEDDAELRGYWDKLIDGGNVVMALEQAPWGDAFGMCVDRFGTSWLVNIGGSPS
jgi:PhnB protein